MGLIEGRPAVFTAVLPFPHPHKPGWREHRTVCLPDFQGVGIGNAMSEFVASMFAARGSYRSTTSNPAMIRHRAKSPLWRMKRGPGMVRENRSKSLKAGGMPAGVSSDRLTAGFEYIGPVRTEEARAFGVVESGDADRPGHPAVLASGRRPVRPARVGRDGRDRKVEVMPGPHRTASAAR